MMYQFAGGQYKSFLGKDLDMAELERVPLCQWSAQVLCA